MSAELGLATHDRPRRAPFAELGQVEEKAYREDSARAADTEVRALLAAAHERVPSTLQQHDAPLRALAA